MAKYERLLLTILRGTADANISFDDLCHLLRRIGFEQRVRGSHHLFRKTGIDEMLNLQRDGSKAKPYQVRQVRSLLSRYKLGVED